MLPNGHHVRIKGPYPEDTVTSYVFSDRDLMTEETSEVSGVTDYTYTPSGQLETKTDARSITETRSYDALDRVTLVDYPEGTLDITYSYDEPTLDFGVGRLASITRDGHSIDYAYDRFGRMTRDGDLRFGYDKNGNRTDIGYPGGAMASYTFDYADREATLGFNDGSGAQSIVTSASYLPTGPLDSLTLGNGLEEIRPYDSRYYPDEIRVNDGVTDLLYWDYTVDGVGNPTAIADVLTPANNRTYAYQDYQYFLTRGDGPWGTRTWTYDTIGNRLTEQKDGGFLDDYDYVQNAAMGNSAKLEQITISGGIRSFMYDAAGNQTQVSAGGNVIDRTYDDAGRMSRQVRASTNTSSDFRYDGRSFLHSAIGREPAAAGTGMFCDGFESGDTSAWGAAGGVCLESQQTGPTYDSSGLLHAVDGTEVLYFAGRPVAQFATAPLFLTTDHLGTPIQATTGEAMTVVWEGGFEPFGADYSEAQAAGVFLRFPGQWNNNTWSESSTGAGLSYNLHRWYSNETGRYSRPDPLGLRGGLRPYLYVRSSPPRWVDLLGLQASPPAAPTRDPFVPRIDPSFPDGPWGKRPNSDCCDKREIIRSMDSADRQLERLIQGEIPSGTMGASVATGHFCQETGWCRPDAPGPNEPFDPFISPNIKDPCVIFCTRVHEWYHFTDTRWWYLKWDELTYQRHQEGPAYEVEKACLGSFLQ